VELPGRPVAVYECAVGFDLAEKILKNRRHDCQPGPTAPNRSGVIFQSAIANFITLFTPFDCGEYRSGR